VIEIEKQEKRRKHKDMVLVFWSKSSCSVNISKQKQAFTQPICGDSSEFILRDPHKSTEAELDG
jgi:hypothetical protein